MTVLAGTNVAAPVRPFDDADTFPTAIAEEIKGGWHAVASTAARDAIPAARRTVGMAVRVVGGDIYEWTGSAWVVLPIEGPQGPQGGPGPTGATGPAGADGADGADGASAYEIAVAGGFVGSEAAWLASLVGPTGPAGADGADGADGATGATGPQGDPGPTGATGAAGAGVPVGGTTGQILAKASGADRDTTWIDPPSGGGGGGTWSHPTGNPVTLANGAEVTVTHPSVSAHEVAVSIFEEVATAGVVYPNTYASVSNAWASFVASASSEYSSAYAAWKAFNGAVLGDSTRWLTNNTTTGWLKLDLGTSRTICAVTLRSYVVGASPRDWTIDGSDDGSSWTTVDAQTGQTFADGVTRTFTFSPATYRYWRINVTVGNGLYGYLDIDEMTFVGVGETTIEECTHGGYSSSQQFGVKRIDATSTKIKNLSGSTKTVYINVITP